jgi:tetratricopeptide (TPR) repeat protein
MNLSLRARAALIGLLVGLAMATTPAQAAKVYFGTQEHLREIQDVEIKGANGEALYLGYKYSFHSFLLPYRLTDDGHILGVRGGGERSYFHLDDADIKSFQENGQLPSPLPSYQLSLLDYAMGHALWIALIVIVGLWPLLRRGKRRRKRAQPHLDDAIALHRAGDLNRAVESYTKAIEIDPKSAVAFNLRGNAFAGLQYFNLGIADQSRAIRIDPKFVDALMARGLLMRTRGNFNGAVSDFSRVIKLTDEPSALYQRGLSYLGKDDLRRAIADFTKVIEAAPNVADAYHQRALAYSKLGDAKRAKADHAKALTLARVRSAA